VKIVPIRQRAARDFVAEHHRHSPAPRGDVIRVGLADDDGTLIGVAMAGRPLARELDDGLTLEILRVCSLGHRNACSMMQGALIRAGRALGFTRMFTYTLVSEPGSSLRAVGWQHDADLPARPGWSTPVLERPNDIHRHVEGRRRWVLAL